MLDVRIHGYEILNEIRIGGMSRLYLAYDSLHHRHVAIKLLPSEYLNDLGFRSLFEREARLIAALKHKAIVPVYEYGVHEGQPFFVMQYMPNGSLADRIARGSLFPDQAGKVLERISSALDYAHRQGIVHRDLKSSNILFNSDDNAYLADFGIALQAEWTWQRNLSSGTPAYISPEQALREDAIDARSDVYSLGIIAFEMLTGRLPFDGDLPVSIILKHIHDPPPSLGAFNPELPAALDPVLHRALTKDPQERYPTAVDFWNAFEGALHQTEGQPSLIGIQAPAPLIEEQETNLPDTAEERPSVQGALPARWLPKPIFPELAVSFDRKSRFQPHLQAVYSYYALGLVIWSAVLLAAGTAVIARVQELFHASNLMIVYDGSAIAVVNLSEASIDLSGVVFQRLSDQGNVTADFSAGQWYRVNPRPLKGLSAGDCFQLLRSGSKNVRLTAGTAPAKPASCEASQGWLVAPDQGWHFWTPDGEGEFFQVIQDDRIIHDCRIDDGVCVFYLP